MKVAQLAGARALALSPDGRELYVAAFDPGAVVVLRRDPSSGRVAPTPPNCLQAAPDAGCPVACEGANSLIELLRNPAEGALALASESPTAVAPLSGPVAVALSPGGQSIYLASPFDDGVAALTDDP